MSRNTLVALVVIAIVILGGWYLLRPRPVTTPAPSAQIQTPISTQSATPATQAVSITSKGFSPNEVTISAGESVTWENSDNAPHSVNSAVHPTHLVYPLLNLGVIKPGDQNSLTFPVTGTYKYHDHLNPSLTGSVTVQ